MTVLAFAAALLGMLCYGIASTLQGYAAQQADGPAVLRHPAYLVGLACDGLAFLAGIVALTALPIFVVQSIQAASLAVTVLLAWWFMKIPVGRRDGAGIAAALVGLVLVSMSAGAESGRVPSARLDWCLLGAVLVATAVAAVLYRGGGMIVQGMVAGLCWGGTALCSRAAIATVHSVAGALASPVAWGTVISGLVGTLLYARALEHGRIGPPTAALWVVEVIAPGALGMWLLGDTIRPGWMWSAAVGSVLAVVGCVVLAYSEATARTAG